MAPARTIGPLLLAAAMLGNATVVRADGDRAAKAGDRAGGAFRTVLVIDASSSMRRTDPNDLRKVAAELFVDLARAGDHIAVTGFDENARQSTGGFTTIDGPAARAQLKQAIAAIGNDGDWTDFTAGLLEAKRLLDAAPDRPGDQELIVFLTDGRCEPDPEGRFAQYGKRRRGADADARETACKAEVLDQLAAQMGARIYAIGLSANAPAAFLEELGRRTGGRGVVTLDPRGLPQIFAGVYARLLGSRLVEGDADGDATFEVYEGARTLDLVIVGRAQKTGVLRDPGGREIPIHNREPDEVYFASSREYRFYKVHRPTPGAWTLELAGAGTRRYATLQHFDLALSLVDPPTLGEQSQPLALSARLASPEGTSPPAEFLDRHIMAALVSYVGGGGKQSRVALRRDGDVFRGEWTPPAMGKLTARLVLEPGPGGVLSRETGELATILIIPPVALAAAPIDVGRVKQGESATATLSMAGSDIGIDVTLAVTGDAEHIRVRPDSIALAKDDEARAFELSFDVAEDAPAGATTLTLTLTPTDPDAFADRAITAPVTIEVVALSFWERYGRLVQYAAGGLVLLVLLLGFLTPATFKKRAMLYYVDVRDLELARRSSYPLGVKAKRGFFRPAQVRVGASGPVKKGGAVVLRAGSGGRVEAAVASSSATVFQIAEPDPEDGDFAAAYKDHADDADSGDRPRVSLRDGGFRMSPGVGYEVKGSGLVFWYK